MRRRRGGQNTFVSNSLSRQSRVVTFIARWPLQGRSWKLRMKKSHPGLSDAEFQAAKVGVFFTPDFACLYFRSGRCCGMALRL